MDRVVVPERILHLVDLERDVANSFNALRTTWLYQSKISLEFSNIRMTLALKRWEGVLNIKPLMYTRRKWFLKVYIEKDTVMFDFNSVNDKTFINSSVWNKMVIRNRKHMVKNVPICTWCMSWAINMLSKVSRWGNVGIYCLTSDLSWRSQWNIKVPGKEHFAWKNRDVSNKVIKFSYKVRTTEASVWRWWGTVDDDKVDWVETICIVCYACRFKVLGDTLRFP